MMRISMQIPTGDTLSVLVPSFIHVLRCLSCQGNADYKRTATRRDFSWGKWSLFPLFVFLLNWAWRRQDSRIKGSKLEGSVGYRRICGKGER